MKNHSFFLFFLFLTIPLFISAQIRGSDKKKSNPFQSDRFFTGGDFGLVFGDVTLIDISPFLGYKVTDKFWTGIGATYQYYRNTNYVPDIKTSVYGGRVFGRYYVGIIENLFAHAEYEVLNYDALFMDPFGYVYQQRLTAHNILVGAGYSQPISENSSLDLMILYNLNENSQSLYSNPVIRLGFNFGL